MTIMNFNPIMDITIIIIFILNIIIFLITPFLKKKGENFADKQDIQILTEKVESIKSSFNEKIEYLKSDLNYKNQNRISVKAYEREALLSINEKYSEWLNSLMNISFSLLSIKNYSQLESYFLELKNKKIEYENAVARLHIFMHDDELMRLKNDCYIATLDLQDVVKKVTYKLQTEFQIIEIYFSNLPVNTREEIEFKSNEYEKALTGVAEIINDFNNNRNVLFASLHPKRVFFVNLLQKKLLEIINK